MQEISRLRLLIMCTNPSFANSIIWRARSSVGTKDEHDLEAISASITEFLLASKKLVRIFPSES